MAALDQRTHRMVSQYHPAIGYLFIPSMNARVPNELGGYFVKTNSQGFRSDMEFCKERSNRPRILFFGDSFTAGDGCNNSERFSELVGEGLNAEVYNYGLSNSGPDQQLLIYEHYAHDIQADLIVWCIYVENIERIQGGYRRGLDRSTGKYVLLPKPYFTLAGDSLQLNHVPVPLRRPSAETALTGRINAQGHTRFERLYNLYLLSPSFEGIRKSLRAVTSTSLRALLWAKMARWSDYQPYSDYRSSQSYGWKLMEAIIRRFCSQAAPVPVLIVPIPTSRFYCDGVEPIYQELFASLESAQKGCHVADVTSLLCQLAPSERKRLSFERDPHFAPFGHRKLAGMITEEILRKRLLPASKHPLVVERQKRRKPGHESTYILGLSCFYHNSAASLVKDGEIIAAAEEERFSRIKDDRNFPHKAANFCLEQGGIQQHDLAAVVYYDNAALTFERLMHSQLAVAPNGEESWLRIMPSWLQYKLHIPQLIRRYLHYHGPLLHEVHHRSHAASAFYPSPFESAAILTVDGVGEWATASIGVGSGNQIRLIKEMRFPNSLGLLYSAFTEFTGFRANSGEYKMMGLAPYGVPKHVDTIYKHLVHVKNDGSLELSMNYFAFLTDARMTNEKFADLFAGPARQPDAPITQREMDLARSIQVVTEDVLLHMAKHAHEITNQTKLCLAGGVALNCVANGRLLREGPFEDIWIQPAAGDAGGALGAALDAYHTYFDKPHTLPKEGRSKQAGSYWGPEFSEEEIRAFLDTFAYPYTILSQDERADTIARYLQAGKVIGHFAGRAEFGPRALGARSILGDARNEEMQTNLNLKIKYRESFRPFAPTVLSEKVQEYFDLDRESPYMLLVAPVKQTRRRPFERSSGGDLLAVVKQARSDIPAVTHVDYSARVQSISRKDHPQYYDVIRSFEHLTGCAVIVNTSFNVRGEPMVCTPHDAYQCFVRTEMDVLVLGNCLLLKEKQPESLQSKGHLEKENARVTHTAQGGLQDALREVYRRDIVPLAAKLGKLDVVRIKTNLQGMRTSWVECSTEQSPRTLFVIPSDMDTPTPDPEKMAAAVSGFWTAGAVTDEVRPFLVKLLELGLRFPEASEFREQVSDSIYVMY